MALDGLPRWLLISERICPSLPDAQDLQCLLDIHGAQEAELDVATRVITDQAHFSHFQEPRCKAMLVTWVYSSVKAGIKQTTHRYSADPAMFFSSLVISVLEVSPSHADLIRAVVTKYGGQWASSLTKNWFQTSFELESLQDTTPYVLFEKQDIAAPRHLLASRGLAPPFDPTQPVPVPFLPFEIMAKIFLMYRDLALEKLARYLRALLDLSQVSQRWRAIAHDTGECAMMRMVESRWRTAPPGSPLLHRVRISTQTQTSRAFASRGIVAAGASMTPLAPLFVAGCWTVSRK
ncbi:hypothetical protein FB451DRAFT_1437608 [Mycena latifolia]|nr:hypothetical protein FB451DRAFT_1437608 [Mycena latifolia]